MTRIIGIDPGSLKTGYGIIESDGVRNCYVASGCIRVKGDNLAQRLGDIYSSLHAVIVQWQPDEMAIEQVFMSNNADSALKLGQARGAAICAGVQLQLPVSEYAAREIKNAVVGSGSALKQQVQHMMRVLLKIDKTLQGLKQVKVPLINQRHIYVLAAERLSGIQPAKPTANNNHMLPR